jgi:hypothetical protein
MFFFQHKSMNIVKLYPIPMFPRKKNINSSQNVRKMVENPPPGNDSTKFPASIPRIENPHIKLLSSLTVSTFCQRGAESSELDRAARSRLAPLWPQAGLGLAVDWMKNGGSIEIEPRKS